MNLDGFNCRLRKQRAKRKREVCGLPHLADRHAERPRQGLPAEFLAAGYARPAALRELGIGVLETFGGFHALTFQFRHLLVARGVGGRPDLAREARGFGQHGFDDVARGMFETGQLRDFLHTGDFVQDKAHIIERGGVHLSDSSGCKNPGNFD